MRITRRPLDPHMMSLADKINRQPALSALFGQDLRDVEMYAPQEEQPFPLCETPVVSYDGPDAFFQEIGFSHSPVTGPRHAALYPNVAMQGDHRLYFLKWGARAESSGKRIIFETGDVGLLASLEVFQKHGKWHVDKLVLESGSQHIAVDCGDPDERRTIERVLCGLRETVTALNEDRIEEARNAFHAHLDPVFAELAQSDYTAAPGAVPVYNGF